MAKPQKVSATAFRAVGQGRAPNEGFSHLKTGCRPTELTQNWCQNHSWLTETHCVEAKDSKMQEQSQPKGQVHPARTTLTLGEVVIKKCGPSPQQYKCREDTAG